MMMRCRRAFAFLVAALSGVLFTTCAVGVDPVTGHREAFGYTWQAEVRLGHEADAEIVWEYGVYGDSSLAAYVTRIGERVLGCSHLRRPEAREEFRTTQFTFRVLDSPVVNAFALPGGYIYVTRGLLAHLDNEAQLAVVIGHEIGHVAGRHASKRALKAKVSQVGLVAGAIVSEEVIGEGAGQAVMDLGSQAAGLLLLKYGRDDERESDRLGVEYAAMAGYRASEAAAFFHSLKRLSEREGGRLPSFLSTHPDPGERESTIIHLAGQWAGRGYDQSLVNQDTLYYHLDGIVLGNNPRDGFTDGIAFYQPDLRLFFPVPPGWNVVNDAQHVAMVSPDRTAQIQFGVVREVTSAREAAARFSSQQGISVVSSGPTTVNGLAAHSLLGEAEQQGTKLSLLSYFIDYRQSVYLFVGLTPQTSFEAYRETFLRTMRGFNELRDQGALATMPARVSVLTTDRAGAFQSFLPSRMPTQFAPEEFAILNQVELSRVIERGVRIKVPSDR